MQSAFAYVRPETMDQAVEALKLPGARIFAGGTDLLGCLREHILDAPTVVSLNRIPELRGVQETGDGGLRLGALASVAEVAASDLVRSRWPGLAEAAASVASPQLRNQGSIGGNLGQKPRCWYYRGEFHCLRKGGNRCYAIDGENSCHCILGGDACVIVHPSDTAPMLAALGARARIAGEGSGRSLPVEELFVLPAVDPTRETVLARHEILAEVVIPAAVHGLATSYRKVRARRSWDFALAGVALALVLEGPRVASSRIFLSGAAPVPWRAAEAEAELEGRELTPDLAERAAKAAMARAAPLSGNAWKVPLFTGLIAGELLRHVRKG